MDTPTEITARTMQFSLRAVRLFQFLQTQKDRAGWIIGKQFLRAATSIGANVEESQAAESRSDFIHKLSIAQKESREARYWLRILALAELVATRRIAPLLQESEEIVAVITTIILNTKNARGHSS